MFGMKPPKSADWANAMAQANQGLTLGGPMGVGMIAPTNIDWSAVKNQYANLGGGAEIHETNFFGQPMTVRNHAGTYGAAVNLLWVLGLRLSMAGLYQGMVERVYSAAPVGDEVVIFMVTKAGKPTLVHDTKALFPSDELITKLRLLEG